jgi:nitroreductase
MKYTNSIFDIIPGRKSVRSYAGVPVEEGVLGKIEDFLQRLPDPPLRSKTRFILASAVEGDAEALRGLGTYGVIHKPAGFVIGAAEDGEGGLVDFGFRMEAIVLLLADLGLGSCWLGGSFRKSRFSERIGAAAGERVPSVVSFGIPAEKPGMLETLMRLGAGSDRRKPFESLFFKSGFDRPLFRGEAGPFTRVLDMVRLAPSASNKQPWRIVWNPESGAFHFFLQRDAVYGRQLRWLKRLDLQQVDLGIAACHFSLAAAESGLPGAWTVLDRIPAETIPENTVYIMTWIPSKP